MSEPLPRCPTGKKGRHELCIIIPESDGRPVLIVCSICGMAAYHNVDLPEPLDALSAEDIARLARK